MLDSAPRRRLRLPWADLFLFAAIAGVLAIWWLQAPAASDTRESARNVLGAARILASPTAGMVAALQLDEPTSTPQPTPTAAPVITATSTLTATVAPVTPTPAGPPRHKVQPGESVALLAQRYGSTIKDIIEANNLPANGRLGVGQELLIPVAGPSGGPGPSPTPETTGLMYTVKGGDTVIGLAERFKSQVDWIMKANGMQPGETLHIGRALLIPLVPATPTPQPAAPVTPLPPTPTPAPGLAAPQLLTPSDGAIISGDTSVLLSWTAVGVLGGDEWYVVTLQSPEKETPIATWWTKSTSWRLPTEYRPDGSAGLDYTWRVQVRRGGQDQPGEATSPSSVTRRFTWR